MSAAARLHAAVERARGSAPVARSVPLTLAFSTFTPWWAQRLALRSSARFLLIIAGRQGGKTLAAAFEVLRRAFAHPGSYSALLAPTYLIADTAVLRIREVCDGLHVRWREQKKRFLLPNGSRIQVFSADRKETVRGPSITGTYWTDEGAYVTEQAYGAGKPALIAGKGRTIVTTTPAGKNWVWKAFTNTEDARIERFRFRSEDAPHTDKEEIASQRRELSPERAAQEFDAVFVDDLLLAFPNVSRLFVRALPDRTGERDLRNVLGVDLGKDQDWLVVTLMNRLGEARILGRWRHVAWPRSQRELAGMARDFQALIVLDVGPGGGPGGVLADYLEAEGLSVLAIKTAVVSTKAQIVEQCRSDVQWERIRVLENEHSDQLRHELTVFQGIKRQQHGREVMVYEGPQLKDEHDDCVISLCLANWGRVHGWQGPEDETEDFSEFYRGNLRAAALLEKHRPSVDLGGGVVYRTPTQIPPEMRRWVF